MTIGGRLTISKWQERRSLTVAETAAILKRSTTWVRNQDLRIVQQNPMQLLATEDVLALERKLRAARLGVRLIVNNELDERDMSP